MVKEGVTMDFAVHDHADERTTAAITSLVEILGHISNALGTGIDFNQAPITKKPTSKKVSIDGNMDTDKTSLGNKSIPGMATSQSKVKTMKKAINPYENKSRDFTGSVLEKEEIDAVVEENMQEVMGEEKIAFGMGAVGARMAGAGLVNSRTDDEEKLSAKQKKLDSDGDGKLEGSDFKALSEKKADMSTSDAKALLSTLEEAAKALERFVNTTRVPSKNVMIPQDKRGEPADAATLGK